MEKNELKLMMNKPSKQENGRKPTTNQTYRYTNFMALGVRFIVLNERARYNQTVITKKYTFASTEGLSQRTRIARNSEDI